jgi:hypothetical protein
MAHHQGSLSKVYKYSNHFLEVYEQICQSQRRNMSLRQTPANGLLLAQHEQRSSRLPKPMCIAPT